MRRFFPQIHVVNFGELGDEGRLIRRPTVNKNHFKGLLGIPLPGGSEIRTLGTRGEDCERVIRAEFWSKFALGVAPGFVRNRGELEHPDGQNFSPSRVKLGAVFGRRFGGRRGQKPAHKFGRIAPPSGTVRFGGMETARSVGEKLRRSARVGPVAVIARRFLSAARVAIRRKDYAQRPASRWQSERTTLPAVRGITKGRRG